MESRALSTVGFVPVKSCGVIIVDASDLPALGAYTWHRHATRDHRCYASTRPTDAAGKRTTIKLHRMVMGSPAGIVDHRNGYTYDCRKANLRVTNHSGNAANAGKSMSSRMTSRFKGVSRFATQTKYPWNAFYHIGKRKVSIGFFDSEIDAAIAADQKARELYGEFARVNFPAIKDYSNAKRPYKRYASSGKTR